jgi:hypothetical protein
MKTNSTKRGIEKFNGLRIQHVKIQIWVKSIRKTILKLESMNKIISSSFGKKFN